MNQRTLMLATLPLAALLAGCQSFGAKSRHLEAGIRVAEPVDAMALVTQQLAEGRAALAARNYATAVASFRSAALEPTAAAEAHNGLAIAYAGIGRDDLADRYFRTAIAEAPENSRYQANLVRLDRTRQRIMAVAEARLAAASRPMPERRLAGTASRASILLVAPQRRLQRISATGVLLRAPQVTRSEAVASPGAIVAERRAPITPPVVRVRLQPIVQHERALTPVAIVSVRKRTPATPAIATTAVLIPRSAVSAQDLSSRQSVNIGARARITLARGELVGSARFVEAFNTQLVEKPVLPVPLFGLDEAVSPTAELALNGQ